MLKQTSKVEESGVSGGSSASGASGSRRARGTSSPARPAYPVLTRDRFADRRAAGRELAQALRTMDWPLPLVLALPRGGVPVAAEVAHALRAPLELLLVRKIGAPGQPELAVAAIASQAEVGAPVHTAVDARLMAATGADQAYVDRGVARERMELERRQRSYLHGRAAQPLKGRTLIVVDDGIATGTTLRAALMALSARVPAPSVHPSLLVTASSDEPLGLVIAVPVAPADSLAALTNLADATVCLWTPLIFNAVGAHYRDFRQVSDEEVVEALAGAAATEAS